MDHKYLPESAGAYVKELEFGAWADQGPKVDVTGQKVDVTQALKLMTHGEQEAVKAGKVNSSNGQVTKVAQFSHMAQA